MAADLMSLAEVQDECEIVVMRVFDAPRKMVFDAWAEPKQLVQWFGPEGFTTTIETFDFREGGEWVMVMHGPDGTNYPGSILFTEITAPEVIAYFQRGGREGDEEVEFHSTVTFEEIGPEKTRLTIRMEFASSEERDENVRNYGSIEGGRQTLERLAMFLTKKGVAA
jgi:uncharacterized protein YndB with AHSA1/START domain